MSYLGWKKVQISEINENNSKWQMAKRRYSVDEDKIARFLKEGRGQGHGADYHAWLSVQDVSSWGRTARIHSAKTGREHHLLSDIETAIFLLLEWSDSVIDIREQFPLDRNKTRRIAADMGVRHPYDRETGVDIVMTTDFLVDIRLGNGSKLLALSAKPASELDDDRIIEKQEIERRYWNLMCADWGLLTDFDLPIQRIKNLRWLHEMQSLEHMTEPYTGYWQDRCNRFLACLPQATGMTIKRFIQHLTSTQGFATGDGLKVLRHLAANKRIAIDLNAQFDMHAPVDVLDIVVLPGAVVSVRRTA